MFFRQEKNRSLELIINVLGITLILLGQLLRVSARGFKSENSSSGHAMIKVGPYALVRNPMYLGILLIGLGIVLMLFKWWAAGIFLVIFISRYIVLIFEEEKKLQAAFPDYYLDYQKQVPRILPKINSLIREDLSVYLPLKLPWLKKEIGPILAVLFGTLLIKSWRIIVNQGIIVYLNEAATLLCVIFLFVGMVSYLSRQTKNNATNQSQDNL
jgi:hypothetical protein